MSFFFFFACGEIEKNTHGDKKAANIFFASGERCCAPKIACCAARNQPPRGGVAQNGYFDPNKCCTSVTAQHLINALVATVV